MNVWIPWDADDEEVRSLHIIREPIPDSLRPAILAWLTNQLREEYGATSEETINWMQTRLRTNLELGPGRIATQLLVEEIERYGDQFLLRVVDLILSVANYHEGFSWPDNVETLRDYLDVSVAGICIVVRDDQFRLSTRLEAGVEEAMQAAIDRSEGYATQHLAKAVAESLTSEPDTSQVLTEGIRAVEAAAGKIVIPADKAPRLAKIVGALKEKQGWKLVFQQRDDGYPEHREVLIGMLETLVFAQQDRHSGAAPTPTEALGHVMLAATLVGWFSTGVVKMSD